MTDYVSPVAPEERHTEYWSWAGGAMYVLLSVVPLTTMAAATNAEAYADLAPVLRWALEQGLATFAGLQLFAAVVLLGLFYGLIETIERADPPYDRAFALSFEVWVGLLISGGLFLFANNLVFFFSGAGLV
jgi:hypothetical protein